MTLRDEDSNLDQIYVNQVVLANYNSTLQDGTYVIMHFRTALRNHMRIVFEGMSSWAPLTMYLGMNTTF